MSGLLGPGPSTAAPPCILVVDDDRRVVDLLSIALGAHGYRVTSAADGDEAVRVALAKRPDLVVLDVRLPKKSGLEVCEILRHDPDDPYLPIIMVSAASETEARLQGFARGADDYLAKPFSPRELVARIRRLLARAGDARESRRRSREAELELVHARDDARRAHADLSREQHLRALGAGVARALLGALDADELSGRFLLAVRAHLGVSVAALLTPERAGGTLVPAAVRGDGLDRFAGLAVRPDGEFATLLSALDRPARLAELERFPELTPELPALIAKGISIVAPLARGGALEGLLVADERRDGEDASRADLEVLGLLCEAAAGGLANVRRCRALADGLIETLVARAGETGAVEDSGARAEAAALVARAARALTLPLRLADPLAHAAALGDWAETAAGRHALALAAGADPTGRLLALARLIERAAEPVAAEAAEPGEPDAVALLQVARGYLAARRQGAGAARALARAMETCAGVLDDARRRALRDAADWPARPTAA